MRPVHFEKQGNLGVVTIDNPPINLADKPLFAAFTEVLDEVDYSDVRALLRGKRKHDICWRREQERPQIAESRHSYGYAP